MVYRYFDCGGLDQLCHRLFGTLARRRISNIYVVCWYYGAFIIAVALMHIINNLAVPISWTRSIPLYSGVVDAMAQWWYGHNAVAFILTAGFWA